jgi:glycosyltransferase involved in cell wall biosynthesis
MARIWAVVPAVNEEKTIGGVIDGVKNHLEKIVVIDDGSSDRTGEIAEKHGAEVVRHEENMGKGQSLRDGFDRALKAGCEAVIVLDGDGQHDPAEIPKFVERAEAGAAGIIVGNRMSGARGMPLLRRFTNRFMSFLISRVCGQRIPDSQCGYRLLKRPVLEKVSLSTDCFETESEMLIRAGRAGFLIESVPVKTIYSRETSKIRPLTDTVRFFRFIFREAFSKGRE